MKTYTFRGLLWTMLAVLSILGSVREGLAGDEKQDLPRSDFREAQAASAHSARTISDARKTGFLGKGVTSSTADKLKTEKTRTDFNPIAPGHTAGVPANDLCGNALAISDNVLIEMNNIDASTDGSPEPSCTFCCGDPQIAKDLWFDYTATCTGTLQVNMCETPSRGEGGSDTKVVVYVGTDCPPLGEPLGCADDECALPHALASILTTRVVRDQSYKIRVGSFTGPNGATSAGIGKMILTCTPDHPACSSSQAECCSAHDGGGCSTPACCDAICSIQPDCCTSNWTESCAAAANENCQVCGGGTGEECIGCIPIQTNMPFFGTTENATGNQISSCGGLADTTDIWHCWTADCTGTATVSTCGSDLDTTLAVYSSCGGIELECNDDGCEKPNALNSEFRFLVTAGTTYFIRVAGFQGEMGDYQLRVACSVSPPNNQCADALPLATGNTEFTTLSANTDGGPLPESCNEGFGVLMGNDVWFDYTGECTGVVTISACNDADFDMRLALYEGCGCPANNADLVACNDDAVGCLFTSELNARVTQGTCYKLRIGGFTSDTGTESGIGSLAVECNPAAVADQCDEVAVETLPHVYMGDNTYSSNDCSIFPGNQTWAAFRLPQMSDVTLDFCGTDPPFQNVWLNLANGCPCSNHTTEAAFCYLCPDGNVRLKWFCLPSGIYYYPVLSQRESMGPYQISVSSSSCTINNVCASAATITNGTTLFSTATATTDGPAYPNGCFESGSLNIDRDIWYRYTATCTGRLRASTCGTALFNTRLALYSATTCPVTNSRLVAFDDNSSGCAGFTSLLEANVTSGAGYLLRVGGASDFGGGCIEITCEAGELACPVGAVSFVEPQVDVVDARSPLHSDGTPAGIDTFSILAPVGAGPGCFTVCETQNGGLPANSVASVVNNGDCTHTVFLNRPITPGAVTTISYGPAFDVTGSFTFHPGNANGDSFADQNDVLALLDYMSLAAVPPWGTYSTNISQDGGFGAQDVVALINVLNGAGPLDAWLMTSKPSNAGVCP